MIRHVTRLSRFVLLSLAATIAAPAPASSQEMLNLHNARRVRHCAPAMAWSPALAAAAQQWAAGCQFTHSPASARPGQGENLAWGSGSFSTAANSVERWYNEVNQYNFAAPGFSPATGHFTQIVWRGSTQVGCGSAVCGGQTFWVCRYSPSGNITNAGQFQANVLPTSCSVGTVPPPGPKPGPTPPPGPKPGPTPPPPPGSTPPPPTPGPTPPPGTQAGAGIYSAFATDSRGRWGYAAHRANQAAANQLAIQGCGGAQVGCRVFWSTSARCVSFAESRRGGYWFAAGGAQNEAQARAAALRFCQSGRAPAGSCQATGVWCR